MSASHTHTHATHGHDAHHHHDHHQDAGPHSTLSASALRSSATCSTVMRPPTSRARVRKVSACWARRSRFSRVSSSSSPVDCSDLSRWASSRSKSATTKRSADHERLWCSLIGYALRPGFGHALDDWRVAQLWTLFPQGVQYAGDAQVIAEWWTLWRRVAGGLGEAAQCALLDAIEPDLPGLAKGSKAKPGTDDRIRLAGALERVPAARKVAVGETLLARLGHKGESNQTWWALGRLGARVPFHGSAHAVVPVEVAERWCAAALAVDWKAAPPAALAATLLARLSGDRARDIDAGLRAQVAEQLRATKQPENWARLVEAVVELDEADRKRVFGEALPPGLRLAD